MNYKQVANRLAFKLHARLLGLVILIFCLDTDTATAGDYEVQYSRITIGSSQSTTDKYRVVDSLTLSVGSELQTGEEFAISSVKLRGNNGVATAIGENSVQITWDSAPSGAGIVGFYITRATDPNGPYSIVDWVSVDKTEYVDSGLDEGVTYYYRIVAVTDKDKEFDWTDPLEVYIQPDDQTETPTATVTLTPTATQTQTHTPTLTYTNTPTPTWTDRPTETPSLTPTPTFTMTFTPTESFTPTETVTDTPTSSETHTVTPTSTETATASPSSTPTASGTPTVTETPTITATPTTDLYTRCNLDGREGINQEDLYRFLKSWKTRISGGTLNTTSETDINEDGQTDRLDLYLFATQWEHEQKE